MWLVVGLFGQLFSFIGAFLLALTAVKGEGEILDEAAPRLPIGPFGSKEYEESLRKMTNVQALLRQSRVAKYGLWIMTFGFFCQFFSTLFLLVN